MNRVLFLGNSHLAALRQAWDTHPGRWPGVAATFLGAHRDLLLQTALRGGRLVPVTPAAQAAFAQLARLDDVDVAGQDLIVLAGCMISVPQVAIATRDMRWLGLPSVVNASDLAAMPGALMSQAAVRATVDRKLAARLGPRLTRHLIAQGADVPILLASQPRISETIRTSGRAALRPVAGGMIEVLTLGNAAQLSDLFEAAAERAMQAAGAGYLAQPAQTIVDHVLTAVGYMQGAMRLSKQDDEAQPDDDVLHANAAYGAAVIDQVAAHL